MKFTILTASLKDAVNRLANIPGAHGAAPRTQMVKLEADLAGLRLLRFSSEAKASINIEEVITDLDDESEPVFVSHSTLANILSACSSKEVQVSSDENFLHFVSGKAKSKIRIFSEEASAEPPDDEKDSESFEMLLEDLTELLNFVSPAASRESAQGAAFCGVCIRTIEGKLNFIATDKRRCHLRATDYALDADAIVPIEGIEALLKVIGSQTGPCALHVGARTLRVTSEAMEMGLTLLEEKFPDSVQKFISGYATSIVRSIQVNRNELVEALKVCSSVADDTQLIDFDYGKKTIKITGGNGRDSETVMVVECKTDGEMKYGVRAKDLATGLTGMKTEEDGMIELIQLPAALMVAQPDRTIFFSLARTTPPK